MFTVTLAEKSHRGVGHVTVSHATDVALVNSCSCALAENAHRYLVSEELNPAPNNCIRVGVAGMFHADNDSQNSVASMIRTTS